MQKYNIQNAEGCHNFKLHYILHIPAALPSQHCPLNRLVSMQFTRLYFADVSRLILLQNIQPPTHPPNPKNSSTPTQWPKLSNTLFFPEILPNHQSHMKLPGREMTGGWIKYRKELFANSPIRTRLVQLEKNIR